MRSVFVEKPDTAEARRWTAGSGWILVWLPAAIAVLMIAGESTDTMSASHTSGWLRPLFEQVFGRFTDAIWSVLHHYARKTGHFAGYGMVCVAFLRGWLLTLARKVALGVRRWWWESNGLAVGSTAAIASLDEWHQTFLPSRTGMVSDVVLDTVGAVVTCAVVLMLCGRMRRSLRSGLRPTPGLGDVN